MPSNWMVKAAKPPILILFLLATISTGAQKIVDRTIEIQAINIELSDALDLIADKARFKLSYNSKIIPENKKVDLFAASSTVKDLLDQLLDGGMIYKQSGDHLIILGPRSAREKLNMHGTVYDLADNRPLDGVTILEVDEVNAARSGPNGMFKLKISGKRKPTGLLVLRPAYRDTVMFVDNKSEKIALYMGPLYGNEKAQIRPTDTLRQVEDLALTRLLVPTPRQEQAIELSFLEERKTQFSLIPSISTNRSISGSAKNKFSVNLIAGYQGGLDGVELGGVANLDRKNVNGLQMAGVMNLVGGHTRGVQMAGVVNNTLRSLNGLQLSGFANVVWDTLSGSQITGGVNMLRGGMKGAQVSGVANITTKDCDGAQISVGVNVTVGDVSTFQAAGLVNYGRNLTGSQFALGLNVASGAVSGGQLGIISNYASVVYGSQVGMVNVCSGRTEGVQMGVVNFSKNAMGGQVGLINISDTIQGLCLGFLSFATRGYHRGEMFINELMPINFSFRTGTSSFYNYFSYGRSIDSVKYSLDSTTYWMLSYGFGGEINWPKRHTVNIELTGNLVNEGRRFIEALNLVGRLEVIYNFLLLKRMLISAGPSFNVLFSNWTDVETGEYLSRISPHQVFENRSKDLLTQGWIGWRFGLGVRF